MHGPDDGHRLAVAQYGVLKEAQPLLHGPVAGDDEAGGPVAVEDQLVEVCRLLGGEPVEPQVIKDQQVRSEEGPEELVSEAFGSTNVAIKTASIYGRLLVDNIILS